MTSMAASLLACTKVITMVLAARSEFEVDECEMRTELLQSSAVLSQARTQTYATHTQDAQLTVHDTGHLQPHKTSLQVPKPLYWVHVAKCNSGFARSALFLPGMCQNMSNSTRANLTDELLASTAPVGDLVRAGMWIEDECPGDITDFRNLGIGWGDHSGIGSIYESIKGEAMIILRQPEQRLISAYYNFQNSWPTYLLGREANDILEFASVVGGCATKMLTRSQTASKASHYTSACGDPHCISEQESQVAIARLREGFAFVGTIERYDVSVCLLHAMFGGECTSLELGNSHSKSNGSLYDTSELQGWQDVYDRALYAEAQTILEKNIGLYGVTDASCQACWAAASSL